MLGAQPVTTAIGATADHLAQLPAVLSDLDIAIESEEAVQIVGVVARACRSSRPWSAAIEAVAAEIHAVAQAAGPGRAEVEAFAAELAERLFGYALATYLDREKPVVGHLFTLFGIIEDERAGRDARRPGPRAPRRCAWTDSARSCTTRSPSLAPALRMGYGRTSTGSCSCSGWPSSSAA